MNQFNELPETLKQLIDETCEPLIEAVDTLANMDAEPSKIYREQFIKMLKTSSIEYYRTMTELEAERDEWKNKAIKLQTYGND